MIAWNEKCLIARELLSQAKVVRKWHRQSVISDIAPQANPGEQRPCSWRTCAFRHCHHPEGMGIAQRREADWTRRRNQSIMPQYDSHKVRKLPVGNLQGRASRHVA